LVALALQGQPDQALNGWEKLSLSYRDSVLRLEELRSVAFTDDRLSALIRKLLSKPIQNLEVAPVRDGDYLMGMGLRGRYCTT